jgi:superfamily II DNA or RNA helicase
MLSEIPGAEERLILATEQYIGEGFDDPRLDTLFLAMPFSFKRKMIQYAGRLHRPYDGKSEIRIYDYVDRNVAILSRMYEKRLKAYKLLGYTEWATHA